MLTQPCSACPFRVGAAIGYDADAMEALQLGMEPCCHQIVGVDRIFHENNPTTNRCRGFDAWEAGVKGYAQPIKA